MSRTPTTHSTTQSPKPDKGKGRLIDQDNHRKSSLPKKLDALRSDGDPAISSAVEEALETPLSRLSISSSVDSTASSSSFGQRSPIPRPPLAHHTSSYENMQPRILSQLARSTLPTASLTYASARSPSYRAQVDGIRRSTYAAGDQHPEGHAESSKHGAALRRVSSPMQLDNDPFPDLDPTTGLPIGPAMPLRRDSDAPSLHLQRTITGLLETPKRAPSDPPNTSNAYLPSMFNLKVGMPTMPSLPNIPSLPNMPSIPSIPNLPGFNRSQNATPDSRRNFSTTSQNDDWLSGVTGWWGGNKKKVDATLSEEDQAETVEEEKENIQRKCKYPAVGLSDI